MASVGRMITNSEKNHKNLVQQVLFPRPREFGTTSVVIHRTSDSAAETASAGLEIATFEFRDKHIKHCPIENELTNLIQKEIM